MASFVWGRSPQEAFKNPYEYDGNKQFANEAFTICKRFLDILMKKNLKFGINDRSLQKAEWIILNDCVDGALDSLDLINKKKHRIASRIFRDIIENIDLLEFFNSETEASTKNLDKWFDGEFIPHRISREHIKRTEGEEAWNERKKYYQELSSFTHRTYSALKDSYSLGKNDKLVYDRIDESGFMVLPQTISAYYAVLGDIVIQLSEKMATSHICEHKEVASIWVEILKIESAPRRFAY